MQTFPKRLTNSADTIRWIRFTDANVVLPNLLFQRDANLPAQSDGQISVHLRAGR